MPGYRPQSGRGGHCPAHPRWHRHQDSVGPQGYQYFGAGGDRRPPRRTKGAALDQKHGRRKHGSLGPVPRRSGCARPEAAGIRDRRRRSRPRGRARGALGRQPAHSALHGPQAPQPARPSATAAARLRSAICTSGRARITSAETPTLALYRARGCAPPLRIRAAISAAWPAVSVVRRLIAWSKLTSKAGSSASACTTSCSA